MKLKSKILAAFLSMACLCSAAPPLLTSAVTYDPRDVNRDGTVSLTDAVIVLQHVQGSKYYKDYHRLDTNGSHTVDATDSQYILNSIMGASYSACYIRQSPNAHMEVVDMPAVSGGTPKLDDSVSQTDDRWYIGYSYTNNQPISRYKLTASTTTTAETSTPRTVIGPDDRDVAHGYENTGIVRIEWENGITGTGFIVGDYQIATSAHCVYKNNAFGNFSIKTFDRTGQLTGDTLTVSEVHIPEQYIGDNYEYDYALITTEENLSEYVHFAIASSYNMTESEASAIPLHVTGQRNGVLYSGNGSVFGNNNTSMLGYTADAVHGQSGSPVYTITRVRTGSKDTYTYTALAIHRGGVTDYNTGPLMTKYHMQFYYNNDYANY